MTFSEYLEYKGLSESEVSKEAAYKAGQATVIALFADLLHISLSYDTDWDNRIKRLFEWNGLYKEEK